MSAAPTTRCLHTGQRTSLIVDPPNGRIPPLTPEAQQRRDAIREFQHALLQATDTCKNDLLNCVGGQYGPPSPRRAETPPHYLTSAVNRADGPEDRSLGERCMSASLPDFGGRLGFSFRSCSRLESCRFSMTRARAKGGSVSSPSRRVRIYP